ncbi:ORF6C domain-containing protein [Fodinisporobacter ferrooxydans]|uniref:ORF6C domain-containing protein n=1 Tax=Fodinisporobacter ferrooxydans TaxID=2901836 RepID=A0ABY4CKF8_9BACL|nr:ORF6C domain-containing protein [Alicyclobacillaceae bacterium MYW30-H2]
MLSEKVIELHGVTVKNLNEQARALQRSFDLMNQMYLEVKSVKGEVDTFKSEMDEFRKEFHDENRLIPGEVDDLCVLVRDRSVAIAKELSNEIMDEKEFKTLVGKIRHIIWRKLNKRYGAAKYIHIKRKYFEESKDFISNFKIEDYI